MKAQKSGIILFAVVLLLIGASIGCAGTTTASETPTTLKEAYKDYFKIGVAINRLVTTGSTDVEADNANRTPEQLVKDIAIVKEQFNCIVNENDLKPILIHPNPGPEGYEWEFGDAFVKFGEDNDLYVTGHTLLWHSQVPRWFFEGTETEEDTEEASGILNLGSQVFAQPAPQAGARGARGTRGNRGGGAGFGGGMFGGFGRGNTGPRATREELIERMREHIHSVVGRYKGKVKVWDVVNEAIGDGGPDSVYRNTQWIQIIGEDFIPMAFKFAHEADPDAILRYNDYGLEDRNRREKLKKIVKDIRDAGAPIHAIGTQTHINTNTTYAQMDQTLTDLETLGLPIHITELDLNVSIRGQRGTGASVADNASVTGGPVISEADRVQSEAYANLFKALIKHKDSVEMVVFWGVCDAVSWRASGAPLLFDGDINKKPAFDAVMKVAIEAKENNDYQD